MLGRPARMLGTTVSGGVDAGGIAENNRLTDDTDDAQRARDPFPPRRYLQRGAQQVQREDAGGLFVKDVLAWCWDRCT
jgi:hypothetical protein